MLDENHTYVYTRMVRHNLLLRKDRKPVSIDEWEKHARIHLLCLFEALANTINQAGKQIILDNTSYSAFVRMLYETSSTSRKSLMLY